MFNPVAQLMALVLATVGMALSYLEADQRKDWWVKGILLYVLPTCFWAVVGIAEFGWVPYPDGCTSSKCRMAAGPGLMVQAYIRMGGVLVVGLVYLAVLTVVRRYWNIVRAWAFDWIANSYKPEQWFVDPATGESYKIKASHRGAIRFSTRKQASRIMDEYDEIEKFKAVRVTTWFSWIATAAMLFYTAFNYNILTVSLLWIMVGISVLCTIWVAIQGSIRLVAARNIGPEVMPPREDTSVEDQRVHDTGGLMNKEQLDAALRGEVGSKPIRSRPQSA